MAISAIDTPASVIVSDNGQKGEPGTNGTDGTGLNSVRKLLIDSPLVQLYGKNKLVETLQNSLLVTRAVGGSYDNIYGVTTAAAADEPREEADGWLITSDETHTYQVYDNFPLPGNGFSIVLSLGSYSGGAVSQNIVAIPATSGNVLTIGTSATDLWFVQMQGSDSIVYDATTIISTGAQTAIVTYSAGVVNVYVSGLLAGTVTLPTALTATLDTTANITLNGNFTLNLSGLRIYDFVLTADEITYLS
jgi:hypothetical protein